LRNSSCREIGKTYNTSNKIYKRIRKCIYNFTSEDDEFLGGEVHIDGSYFGGIQKARWEEAHKAKSLSLAYFQGWKSKSRSCKG